MSDDGWFLALCLIVVYIWSFLSVFFEHNVFSILALICLIFSLAIVMVLRFFLATMTSSL